jgi:hypothetical protein
MNINKYIEQAYTFFTSLAKEIVKELKPDHKMMAEHHQEVATRQIEGNKAIVDSISEMADKVASAVNDKEVVEEVKISNIEDLTSKLDEVISTFQEELGKIDKEIVVKNDLSQLTALFKSGADKKDLIGAIKSIEKKIQPTEVTDYTLLFDQLITEVEKLNAKETPEAEKQSLPGFNIPEFDEFEVVEVDNLEDLIEYSFKGVVHTTLRVIWKTTKKNDVKKVTKI